MITTEAVALKFVNEIRVRYHLEPLTELRPGYVNKCEMCTISESLRECSAISEIRTTPNYVRIVHDDSKPYPFATVEEVFNTPMPVHAFINDFDAGKFPHLLKKKELN